MNDGNGAVSEQQGLGAALRMWRRRVDLRAFGLSTEPGRRTPGMRRRELAQRAGLSEDYLDRLEQGRARTPSQQVVAALARALHLSDDERDHLYRLAGYDAAQTGEVVDELPHGVRRLITRMNDAAIAAFSADWRMTWWNSHWSALIGDPSEQPPESLNFASDLFPTNGSGPAISRWPVTSLLRNSADEVQAQVVSDLRRATGRFPHSLRLSQLINRLQTGNSQFAELWAGGTVGIHHTDHKIIHHPVAGDIVVDCDTLTDAQYEHKIVVVTTETGSDDESRLRVAMSASRPSAT